MPNHNKNNINRITQEPALFSPHSASIKRKHASSLLMICLLLVILCQSLATGAALSVRYANERHAFGAAINHSHSSAHSQEQTHHLSHDHAGYAGDEVSHTEQLPFNAVESIASLAAQYAAHTNSPGNDSPDVDSSGADGSKISSSDIERSAPQYEEHQHDQHSYMASHPPTEHNFISVQRQGQSITPLIQICLTRCDAPPIRPPLLVG